MKHHVVCQERIKFPGIVHLDEAVPGFDGA
jgi:hypothetical protein